MGDKTPSVKEWEYIRYIWATDPRVAVGMDRLLQLMKERGRDFDRISLEQALGCPLERPPGGMPCHE
jgi:hypothetical protein